MSYKRLVTVLCKDRAEINNAVNHWVNVMNYKRLYSANCSNEADHFVLDGAGNWTKCGSNRHGEKIVLLFGIN